MLMEKGLKKLAEHYAILYVQTTTQQSDISPTEFVEKIFSARNEIFTLLEKERANLQYHE